MKKHKILNLSATLAVIVAAQFMLDATTHAATIFIPGGTFSTESNSGVPDFTTTGPIGDGNYAAGTATIFGANNGGSSAGPGGELTSDGLGVGAVGVDIAANTTYTFTLDIGGVDSTAGNYGYIYGGTANMALLANGVAISGATLSFTPATYPGGTPTFTAETVSFDSASLANQGLVGDDLEVQFGLSPYTGTGGYPNVNFQNATLDGTADAPLAAPEPSTWALLFAGLGSMFFVRRLRRRSV